jgi:hypothetical protein
VELKGFCTVKALTYINDSKQNKWDLAGSLQQYPLNSTKFAWSNLSELMNLTGQLVTIKDILIFIAFYIIIESSHLMDSEWN